jgi:hypothetical protein
MKQSQLFKLDPQAKKIIDRSVIPAAAFFCSECGAFQKRLAEKTA